MFGFGCLGIEIQALTKNGCFRRDLSFWYLNINEYHKSWMFRLMFGILDFCHPSFGISLQVNIEKTDVWKYQIMGLKS